MTAWPPLPELLAFGARVKRLRVKRDRTQEELAEAAGFHRTYIGQVEAGLRNPALVNILRLAGALEVDPCRLIRKLQPSIPATTPSTKRGGRRGPR